MESINYKGFVFQFNLYYQPEEKSTLYYSGCGEFFEITKIKLNGIDAEELLESQREEFENAIIQELRLRNQ
jgi:hypothetical protein